MMKHKSLRVIIGVIAVAIALVMPVSPAVAAGSQGPIETVSERLDSSNAAGWWSPIATFGGSVFMAYNTDVPGGSGRHETWVARRDPNGAYVRGCLQIAGTTNCSSTIDDPGHNNVSISVDGRGYIHAFANMHNSEWHYYRSAKPMDPTNMVDMSASMPDQDARYTYPSLTRAANGDLWMIIRARFGPESGRDFVWGEGRLYRLNNATGVWSRVTVFAKQGDATVYPDQVTTTTDGYVHISYEWCFSSAGGLRHLGSYVRVRMSDGQVQTADGRPVGGPASTTTPQAAFRPMGPNETRLAGDGKTGIGLQVTKIAMHPDPDGSYRPIAVYRYRDTETGFMKVYRATWGENGGWSSSLVYGGAYDTTGSLSITDDGTTKRIYYAKRDTAEVNNMTVAESVNGGPFVERQLAQGKPIHRFMVIPSANGTDHLYLSTEEGSPKPPGQLYYTTLTR